MAYDEIRETLRAIQTRLEATVTKEDLAREIKAAETRLLSAFFQWARSTEARIRVAEGTVAGVHERLASIESRLLELERGRIPPRS